MLTLNQQVYLLLVTLACGLTLGLFFDIYRTIRWVVKPNRMSTFLGDLAYWLLMTGLVFKVLLFASYGEVRLYIFISLALGGYLYFSFLSRFVLKLLQKAILVLSALVAKAVHLIRAALAKIEAIINKLTNFISIPLRKITQFIRKVESVIKKNISRIPLPKLPKLKIKRKKIRKEGPYSIGQKKYRKRKKYTFSRD